MNFIAADTTPFWLLDSVAGWQTDPSATAAGVVESITGDLRLQSLPGTAQVYANGALNGIGCPAAAAFDECGVLFVLDPAACRLWRVETGTAEARVVHEIGGRGHDARRFETPRGFALLPRGGAAVCDTENHRVQVFSGPPYALTQLWGKGEGEAGNGPLEFQFPWGITYGPDGYLYIADRGNARVQRVRPDGSDWSEIGVGVLQSPAAIAVSASGAVAVVDYAGAGSVVMFAPGSWAATTLTDAASPRSAVFDDEGNLYVGSTRGLVFEWTPGLQYAGAGVSGLEGSVEVLAFAGGGNLLAGILQTDVTPQVQRLWTIGTDGACIAGGSITMLPLDSGIENCVWHRVQVEGTVPAGTSLRVETVATPDTSAAAAPWQTALTAPPPIPAAQLQALTGQSGLTAPNAAYTDPDGLAQGAPGRYLRLRITMTSNGVASPEIHAIRVYFPRQSYLQYLPANFQDDDRSRLFLERFLCIFQTSIDGFDRRIDNLWRLFDPSSTPENWYNWLAAWIALPINPNWTLTQKRQVLKQAPAQYLVRGTAAGLQQAIQDYAGVAGSVLEHYKLRRWPMILSPAAQQATAAMTQYDARLCAATPLWSRAFYARLQVGKFSRLGAFRLTGAGSPATDAFTWGASQFTVFFPADPYNPSANQTAVQQVVEREKPAHTQAFYAPILPRMRVGVQASVGIDTYVSRITYTVLNGLGTLGYDSILGASKKRKRAAALGSTVPPMAGVSTRLL